MSSLQEYLSAGAVIVDVRTPEEFRESANLAAINIPISELALKLNQLDKTKPVVVCCRSGGRSAVARTLLANNGFERVLDVGPWRNSMLAQ